MEKQKLKDPGKKRMLLALPLLIIPFLTMAFWALGGGKADAANAQKKTAGLNLELPNAQLKDDKGENKLSYYEQAEKDSIKWKEKIENDPFFQTALNDSIPKNNFGYNPYSFGGGNYSDPNEQKVYGKLAELNSHLKNPNGSSSKDQGLTYYDSKGASFNKEDVDRLEDMMKNVSSPGSKDPEVEQLNGMMDRILDIQHPERVKQRLGDHSEKTKEQVYSASARENHFTVSLLDTGSNDGKGSNAFYSVDNEGSDHEIQNAIEALIHETQSLIDGSIVKMRVLDDMVIGESVIPKGSFVFGKASLEGERLHIEINSIRKDNSLYPVKLVVYDLDGMEGIYIPGAITRDVAKQSADNSLQNIGMTSIDPSFRAQAASAGISAAKTLLSKKAKLVKVTVKDGYKVLLKEKL